MSSSSFNCIFCTETFESREDLQIHFRKHGDPNLHASLKSSKKRVAGAAGQSGGAASAGAASKTSEISCDVCEEKFPTIARAITHKHKIHPDYKGKHFCCWCGKLFPIKHLFDKHKTAHAPSPAPHEVFRCDECCFDFFTATAVSYHNRSFHRTDTPAPHLVGSRKYKLINKDLVQIFFCFLCGREFINSLNLQKHLTENHTTDEWSEPGSDVLRCPRCDVLFHSELAYRAHLSYHSAADIYVHTQEPFPELEEYTIETVPPVVEKMEAAMPVDLDNLLSVDLDLSHGPTEQEPPSASGSEVTDSQEKAPRKAITLNQFLSMNKDVFGDVFNFQGVEEVPSQVIANQLRPKRPRAPAVKPGSKIVSAQNLQKLKDQGVVVHVKNTKKPVAVGNRLTVGNGVAVGKPLKVAPSAARFPLAPASRTPRPALMKVVRPPGVRAPAPRPPSMRPSTQLRPPGVRAAAPPRPPGPRPPSKPLKVVPNPPRTPVQTKKQTNSESSTPGPFSCFKKPKESLIPISDVPGISELFRSETSVSSPNTKPSVTSSLPAVHRNSSILAPTAKPIASPVARQKPSLPDTDSNKSKNKTDEALEKLRKQGLLVKKPRVDGENSRESSVVDAPCLTVKGGG